MHPLSDRLFQGCEQLDLVLEESVQLKLLAYIDLISKWNKSYNLTAIREPSEMLDLHILDSLSIARYVEEARPGDRFIDVGTGAGLPGVVLAIIEPSYEVSLLDTNGKKCRFLNQVKIDLALKNIQIIHNRVEKYLPDQPFDLVLSRAFATLKDMTDNAAHLLSPAGRFFAMKGRYPEQELEELDQKFILEKTLPLNIPGRDVERFLIDIAVRKT